MKRLQLFADMVPLIEAVVNDTADDKTIAALSARLNTAEVRRFYLDYIAMHHMLQWQIRPQGAELPENASVNPRRSRAGMPLPVKLLAAMLVICAMIGVGMLVRSKIRTTASRPNATVPTIAVLSALSSDAKMGSSAVLIGSPLGAGRISLKSGEAQIRFNSAAVVDLTAPCELDLIDQNRCRLLAGQLQAAVPAPARGFTVDLPDGAKAVDLGTRFTVRVDPVDQCEVRVEQGHVNLFPSGATKATAPARLAAGNTAHVVHGHVNVAPKFAYDFSTANASPPGVPLNVASLDDHNDNWFHIGGVDTGAHCVVRNSGQPDTHFKGNYFVGAGGDNIFSRANDEHFTFAVPSDAQTVTLSFVVSASRSTKSGLMGIVSGRNRFVRFGVDADGHWAIRDFSFAYIFNQAGTGPAALGAAPKTYRPTLRIDLVQWKATLAVENLTDGGSTTVTSDLPLDLSHPEDRDPSRWSGICARVNGAAIDDFTISYEKVGNP